MTDLDDRGPQKVGGGALFEKYGDIRGKSLTHAFHSN
jgi:hypothetical protein